MEKKTIPNPNKVHPVLGFDNVTYIKPTITRGNIVAGDFSYVSDIDFESHVGHHYEFYDDHLYIGKFCQIASGVQFVMNGANHQMNAVSTFPFYIFEGWDMDVPPLQEMPVKGDTVVGNDVWIGQNSTILPGVTIGDGVIVGANSVVGSSLAPYTVAVGNPCRPIRKRFDEDLISLLLAFKWWDKPIDEINSLIPLLTSSDLPAVKQALLEKMKLV